LIGSKGRSLPCLLTTAALTDFPHAPSEIVRERKKPERRSLGL